MTRLPDPDSTVVAWAWVDGWTLVRATTSAERDGLLDIFEKVLPISLLEFWKKWDDEGLETHLFMLDEGSRPRAVVVISTNLDDADSRSFSVEHKQVSADDWFRELVHFVSMVRDVADVMPRVELRIDFEHKFREHDFIRSHEVARSVLAAIDDSGGQGQDVNFAAFSPHMVQGRCPDPASEVHLLMGILPDIFRISTLDLEPESR